jgi:hypothetical protein
MAWTLEQQHQRTSASPYPQRISTGFLKTAFDVINEDPGTVNHAQRMVFANNVVNGVLPPRAVQILHVLNPALQVDDPSDNDILFTISQQWDFFANRLPAV